MKDYNIRFKWSAEIRGERDMVIKAKSRTDAINRIKKASIQSSYDDFEIVDHSIHCVWFDGEEI